MVTCHKVKNQPPGPLGENREKDDLQGEEHTFCALGAPL